jgi:hypothetical protein
VGDPRRDVDEVTGFDPHDVLEFRPVAHLDAALEDEDGGSVCLVIMRCGASAGGITRRCIQIAFASAL